MNSFTRLEKFNIHPDTVSAIFIILIVSAFILPNFVFGFILPIYFIVVFLSFAISVLKPKSGFYAIIFLTIIFERFFTLSGFILGRIEYKIYLLDFIILGIILGIIMNFISEKIKKTKIVKSDLFLGGFIILNIIYFFVSVYFLKTDFNLAFSSVKNYAFYSLFYFIVIFTIQNRQDLNRLLKFFFIGGLMVIGFIIFGIFNGVGLWSEFTPMSTGGARILAFPHGLYLALSFIGLLLWIVFKKREKVSNWLYVVLIIWTIGILGTMMRHIWIGLFLILISLYFFVSLEQKKQIKKIAQKGIIFLVIIIFIISYFSFLISNSRVQKGIISSSSILYSRVESFSKIGKDESFSWRELVWKESYKKFKKSPILGIGTGKTIYVENDDYRDKVEIRNIHNSYLAILIQLGFVGLILLLATVYQVIKGIFESKSLDGKFNFYQLFTLGYLGFFLCLFFFQPYLETNLLSIFFWITLGIGRILPNLKLN